MNNTLTALTGVRVGHAAARAVQERIYDACRRAESVDFVAAYGGIVPAAGDAA